MPLQRCNTVYHPGGAPEKIKITGTSHVRSPEHVDQILLHSKRYHLIKQSNHLKCWPHKYSFNTEDPWQNNPFMWGYKPANQKLFILDQINSALKKKKLS